MIAQKHPGNAHFARGFCRHGPLCFEDEKDSKIEAFSTAQIRLAIMALLKSPPGLPYSSSDAAETAALKVKAPRLKML
jgi:hypothetical protein